MSSSVPERAALAALAALLCAGCGGPAPGTRWVHEVELQGVEQLDEGEIADGLGNRETSWWSWTPFADKHDFDEATLDQDLRRIEAYYRARGFFDASARKQRVVQRADGESVDIYLAIDEGKSTRFASVEVAGLEAIPDELQRSVGAELGIAPGQRFDHAAYLAARKRVLGRLERAGYAYARVEGQVDVDRDRRTAEVRIRAAPGPRVRFGPTTITGNGPIPADKLARLTSWREGDRYDADEIAITRARLYNERVFGAVKIELPDEPTAVAPVTIDVTPTKLRELRLGVGVGVEKKRHEARLRGVWTWRNFLGGLRTLELQLRPAYVAMPAVWDAERHGPAVESEAKLTQPDAFSTGISVYGKLGYDLGIHEGYRFHGPRAQTGLERLFLRDHINLGASWNFQFFDFFDIDDEVFDASTTALGLEFVDPYRLAWLEPFVRLDWRDSRLDPRSWFLGELRGEFGFAGVGSQFTYIKVTPEARLYLPLGTRRVVLALRALFGTMHALDDGSTPVTRRYYQGGPSSHRGFGFGRLSPQSGENRIPLGGNASLLGSADLRVRVYRLLGSYWIGLGAFADYGDVVSSLDELDVADMHLAVGGGINMGTPIGSIRFAVGVRLNRLADSSGTVRDNPDPGERVAFHLTIGEAF